MWARAGAAAASRLEPRSYGCTTVLAASEEAMAGVLAAHVPELAQVARVGPSYAGDGLGLFAVRAIAEGKELHRWSISLPGVQGTLMEPGAPLVEKFGSAEYGALAFQVLRAVRSEQPSPWRDWQLAGAAAPATHPLKLLLSDPPLAKRLWSSTTCGGRMSVAALQLRDDLELMKGSAELEEWAEALALVMSRSVVQDEEERPLLALGLDLVQDGEDPNVETKVIYERLGAGPLGLGGRGEPVLAGVALIATRDIEAGEELTMQYLPQPQGGKYLELYGFLPRRLQGTLGDSCVELSFAATDEDEDDNFGTKESVLEDVQITTDPIPFYFCNGDPIFRINDSKDWDNKLDLDRMVQILRMRLIDGADLFLLDSVLIDDLWDNCSFRISKENEKAVCKAVIEECDRWLTRFRQADAEDQGQEAPPESPAAWAADVRRAEAELLNRVRGVFVQEARDTLVDESRQYWAERKMENLFPQSRYAKGKARTGIDFIDN